LLLLLQLLQLGRILLLLLLLGGLQLLEPCGLLLRPMQLLLLLMHEPL
jgi:hypothetical protein